MRSMLANLYVRLLVLSLSVVLALAVVLAIVKYVPGLAVMIFTLLGIATLIAIILTVIVDIAVAVEVEPPRPVSETSLLGKHIVSFAKVTIGLLAFFGNTAVTWLVSLSVTMSKSAPFDITLIENQLWPLFLTLLCFIAYFFWMWVAIDLTRVGRVHRRRAVRQLGERWSRRLDVSPRAMAGFIKIGRWIAGGPWWQTFFSFYVAPLLLVWAIGVMPSLLRLSA